MRLERSWDEIAGALSPSWQDVRLVLTVAHPTDAQRAAALLAAAHPLCLGATIRLHVHRESGVGAEAVARILRRVDDAGIAGSLELESESEREVAAVAAPVPLTEAWDAAIATLPADWSDLVAEVALTSSDHIEPVALLMSPTQPSRSGGASALRFRSARRFGYGVSPGMARRCLERVDAEEIPGTLSILWALSDTHNVSTQGPVWHLSGRTV